MEQKTDRPFRQTAAAAAPSFAGSLTGRIFRRRCREAGELLSGDTAAVTLSDSLDCGKLAKLVKYLRQGVPCLLTGLCCARYVFL